MSEETNNKTENLDLIKIYGSKEESDYATSLIEQINNDLELREKNSLVFNGVSYSQGYAYNQRKGINYAPPRNPKDDREISLGLVHEKIVGFIAIFLKYIFKRRVKCYNEKGEIIKGLGEVFDLAIEFSYKFEQFKKKIALIYWEVFTQGNAFVMEDWEVKTITMPKAYFKEGDTKKAVDEDNMDFTFEFLDNLVYEEGEERQLRRAVSVLLDGRSVIFGNPEIEDVQDQPRITIEEVLTKADAEAMFETLKRWEFIPKSAEEITQITDKKLTLFSTDRHKDPSDRYLRHIVLDKENNRFNVFLNGIMMLPSKTPMSIFHPRMNYPLTNIPCERLKGSIYARSIPAKTKFNADFVDWSLKMLANKFEQGINPAILSKKYTLTRDIFRAGKVTHGIDKTDYEKVDPDNKGITNPEFSFVNLLKEILETQTINPTTSGELSSNTTATEIATVENNQRDKLGFMLDGLIWGFMDMALRRVETIESKYTIKQKETIVDGKKIPVYQNFSINVSGIENVVMFDEEVGSPNYDVEAKQYELFDQSFKTKKEGIPTEYYLVSPKYIKDRKYNIDIEIYPERIKDTQLQMIQLWDEFAQLLGVFGNADQGGRVDMEELKKEYLNVSGRSDKLFVSQMFKQLEQELAVAEGQGGGEVLNKGSFGKPTIKNAMTKAELK